MLTPREHIEGFLTPLLIGLLGPRFLATEMVRSNAGGGPPLSSDVAQWFVDMLGSNRRSQMVAAARDLIVFDSRPRFEGDRSPNVGDCGVR